MYETNCFIVNKLYCFKSNTILKRVNLTLLLTLVLHILSGDIETYLDLIERTKLPPQEYDCYFCKATKTSRETRYVKRQ